MPSFVLWPRLHEVSHVANTQHVNGFALFLVEVNKNGASRVVAVDVEMKDLPFEEAVTIQPTLKEHANVGTIAQVLPRLETYLWDQEIVRRVYVVVGNDSKFVHLVEA